MALSEALSDDGVLTGRGNPALRGGITGGMTFFGRSLHTLPFLIPDLHLALLVAYVVVVVELLLIAAVRCRFFGTKAHTFASLSNMTEQAEVVRPCRRLRAIAYPQFRENIAHMALDGLNGQPQGQRNLPVCCPLCHEVQHL